MATFNIDEFDHNADWAKRTPDTMEALSETDIDLDLGDMMEDEFRRRGFYARRWRESNVNRDHRGKFSDKPIRRLVSDKSAKDAFKAKANARENRLLFANREMKNGTRVAVRRNLNLARHGEEYQTVHPTSRTGRPNYSKAVGYDKAVTLKAVSFDHDEKKRKAVAKGGAKSPFASVVGSVVNRKNSRHKLNGVVVKFDMKSDWPWVTLKGVPVFGADEATVAGKYVFLRGNVRYDDPGE